MLVIGTTSLTLADGTKQAELVGCNNTYLSKLHQVAIFFKVESLCANYICINNSGDVFVLLLQYCMLLYLPPTGGNCLINRTRLGIFLFYKH